MKTDGGWVSISECARLYGKHRKWVYDQIDRYNLETWKDGNRTRLRLVDIVAQRGEPQAGAPTHTANHSELSQKNTPENTTAADAMTAAALLKQENQFLRQRVEELKQRQVWLEGLVDRYTAQLPAPERVGWFARLVGWARNT